MPMSHDVYRKITLSLRLKMATIVIYICAIFGVVYSSDTLKYVQILFRHGDRTPTHAYPTDPYQASAWPQGWQQLTREGMQQTYELGQYVRSRYVDTGFLPGNYTAGDIYVLSSYKDRCIMSADCMLAGLYPPYEKWNPAIPWQPVPVHTIPHGEDFMLKMACPRYDELFDKLMKSDYVKSLTEKYQDLIDQTGRHSGYQPTFENLIEMVDPVYVETSHNLTLPEWLTVNETYKQFIAFKNVKSELKFPTLEMARIRGGPILKHMLKQMEDVKSFNNVTHKIDFFSAHDTTINGLLSALQVYNKLFMMYASAVFVELHHSTSSGWNVQIFFRNDTTVSPYLLTVPGCTSSCPLSTLRRLTKNAVPDDPVEECLGPRSTPAGHSCTSAAAGTHFRELQATVMFLTLSSLTSLW